MFNLEEEIKNLPENPGVYIMHDKNDKIIYVGKAKILKNRVTQYFRKNQSHTPKVLAMVSNVAYFEYIVTDSEIEALVLECTLIKKYRPKYNILLKDDKQYPYLKVSMNEDWPKIYQTRQLKNDGAKYFGPYMGTNTIKNTLYIISKIFMPPLCKKHFPDDIGKTRPCLNYHIKKCFAPCMGNITAEEYRKVFEEICVFLEGDHKKLKEDLVLQMKEASKNLDFEKAADLRDKIQSLDNIDEKQKMVNSDKQNDKDIIAVTRDTERAFVQVFFVRSGRLNGRENYIIDDIMQSETKEILTDFIKQFYMNVVYIPEEILICEEISDKEVIEAFLRKKKGKKVSVLVPVRGEKVRLVEMARKNAEIEMNNYAANIKRNEEKKKVNFETAKYLGLSKPVRYIESYDISNISGSDNVASMVVFENGKSVKKRYRKFKIKSFEGSDDYRAMQEVIYRRLNEAREEEEKIKSGQMSQKDAKFLPLPDCIFVDGGMGHMNAVKEMLQMCDTEIPVFGMVKDDKHRTRALLSFDGEIGINPTGSFFHLITRIQDEVHRFAINYHHNLHEKITSELDNIKGVGKVRKESLLKKFKSVDNIKKANFDELLSCDGMDRKSAESVYNYFNGENK